MREDHMQENTPMPVPPRPETAVDGLAGRERIRELAQFLGLDVRSIAAGLVEAMDRDPKLLEGAKFHRAA